MGRIRGLLLIAAVVAACSQPARPRRDAAFTAASPKTVTAVTAAPRAFSVAPPGPAPGDTTENRGTAPPATAEAAPPQSSVAAQPDVVAATAPPTTSTPPPPPSATEPTSPPSSSTP